MGTKEEREGREVSEVKRGGERERTRRAMKEDERLSVSGPKMGTRLISEGVWGCFDVMRC